MGEVKKGQRFFLAEKDGELVLLKQVGTELNMFQQFGTENLISAHYKPDLNLTPVTLHKGTGVWIEGVTKEGLSRFAKYAKIKASECNSPINSNMTTHANLILKSLAQLSPRPEAGDDGTGPISFGEVITIELDKIGDGNPAHIIKALRDQAKTICRKDCWMEEILIEIALAFESALTPPPATVASITEKQLSDHWQEGFRTGKEARLFDTLEPVGEFFRRVNNGEVVLERIEKKHPIQNGSWNEKTDNFRITITPKGDNA